LKREKKKKSVHIKVCFIVFMSFVVSGCIWFTDNRKSLEKDEKGEVILQRNDHGEGDKKESLNFQTDGINETIEITVEEKEYDEEQLKKVFEQAQKKLETYILGENESLSEVRSDLNLITEIPENNIKVSWELDDYSIMDVQGNLKAENVSDEGTLLGLKALLTYKEESRLYEFYVHVFPPKRTKEQKTADKIKTLIYDADKETKEQEYLVLPKEIEGKEIKWSYPLNYRAVEILILSLLMAVLFYFAEKQKIVKEQKKKKMELQIDYPQIINSLVLYMGAGMTIRAAWFKTVEEYKNDREKIGKRAAYEEMIHAMYEMQRGKTERECYEDFGSRCDTSSYRKLSAILSQNLQKGSKGLTEILKIEAADAFEERKNLARKSGEEAGTKLLIPMFIMLAIVMAIMIVPAFFSIQIS
jgi:tight adherence protein C